jgi:TatA/E family protein of Tat protein translocase
MNTIAFMGPLGVQEITILLVIIFFLFGAKKLPQLAKGIRESITEFRKGSDEVNEKKDKQDEN